MAAVVRRLRAGSPGFVVAHVITWCLLWGEFSPGNLLNGLLLGLAITYIFPMPKFGREFRIRPWGFLVLVAAFVRDMVVSTFQVARTTLRWGYQPRSSLVEVQLVGRSDLFLTFTCDLLTLVPGSLVVETDREGGRLWMHFFDAHTPEQIEKARRESLAQELRVLRAFSSTAELRELGLLPERGRSDPR